MTPDPIQALPSGAIERRYPVQLLCRFGFLGCNRWRINSRNCVVLFTSLAQLFTTARAAEPTAPSPTTTMESIVVTAKRLSVETLIDRKVYAVQSDVQSTFGTVSDVLSAIPSVNVDADGLVSLRGDTHVLVLIDGRSSTQFSGPAAGDNLQSIPAADIERIEILTNPPAQYKADGAAGVINIITRKKRPNGRAGSVRGSLGSGGRSVVGANASYSAGPLSASATGSFREDYRRRLVQSDLVALDQASGQFGDSGSSTDGVLRRNIPSVALSAQYVFNDHQTISADATRSSRGGLRTYRELNSNSLASGLVIGSSQRLGSGHDLDINGDERIGFSQQFAHTGETLDLSAHRSSSNTHEHYDYANYFFIPAAANSYDNLGFRENFRTLEFNADYTLPISKAKILKLGYALEQDDYQYGARGYNVDPLFGTQALNPALTNDFKFRQHINSIYVSYQTTIGLWSILSGLRGELVQNNARQITEGGATDHRYLRAYPNLHVDRSLSVESTLSFSVSRRITRPDSDTLNPYIDHEYTPNLTSGNPDLRPQFTQSHELGYAYEEHARSYALAAYYRINRDSVTDVTEDLGNGYSLTTKTNLPKSDAEGMEFTASGQLIPKLTYGVSGNAFRSQIHAAALGITGLQTTSGVDAKLKLDYRLTSVDSAQVTFTRTDKRLTAQGTVSAINIVNFGYRRQMTADLTAVVTVSDLFNGQRYERFAATSTFTEDYRRFAHGRIMYVGLVYTFGSSKKEKSANFEYDP